MSLEALLFMSAQAALIVAIGALVPNRVVLVVAAIAAVGGGIALGFPADWSRAPGELLVEFAGAFVGLSIGWWVVGVRRRQQDMSRGRRRLARNTAAHGDGAGTGSAMGVGIGLLVAVAMMGTGWHYLGDHVPAEWRAVVNRWIELDVVTTPTVRSPAGKNENVAPTASGTAAAAGKSNAPEAAAKANAPERPAPRAKGPVERSHGDVRHCLGLGSNEAVLKCAEGG